MEEEPGQRHSRKNHWLSVEHQHTYEILGIWRMKLFKMHNYCKNINLFPLPWEILEVHSFLYQLHKPSNSEGKQSDSYMCMCIWGITLNQYGKLRKRLTQLFSAWYISKCTKLCVLNNQTACKCTFFWLTGFDLEFNTILALNFNR